MSETSRSFAEFADESYSWKSIERPALTMWIVAFQLKMSLGSTRMKT